MESTSGYDKRGNESCVLSALQIKIAKALTSLSIIEAMPLESQRRAAQARHMNSRYLDSLQKQKNENLLVQLS